MKTELLVLLLMIGAFASMTVGTTVTSSVNTNGTNTVHEISHTTEVNTSTNTSGEERGQEINTSANVSIAVTVNGTTGAVTTTHTEVVKGNRGTCEFEYTREGNITEIDADCELTLPTPCYSITYTWVPVDRHTYKFQITAKQTRTVCVQVVKKVEVKDSIKVNNYGEDVKATYEFKIEKIAPGKMVRERAREIGEKIRTTAESSSRPVRVGPVVSCIKERMVLRDRLSRLYIQLEKAREAGVTEAESKITDQISEIKEKLEKLPPIEECKEQFGEKT